MSRSEPRREEPGSSHAETSIEQLWAELASSPRGLSTAEAERRLARDGPNAIPEVHRSALVELASHFWGAIPWMIEAALVLSLVAGHWLDAGIIGALLVMNGAVAFWEEHQAGDAIAALKERLAATARVRRDGEWTTVDAARLVAGDVIRLRLGDIVPADARLFDGSNLEVDQSALTGESLPVAREVGDLVYSGSIVTIGEADAAVTATGPRSYFGRTAGLVEQAGQTSHFQQAILRIARFLIVLAAVLVVVTVAVGLARGNDAATMLEFALVVVIAAVPVALPAVLSVTMAVGAGQLARHQAVVSRIAAVEELGSVDVLCSDKTGTLTQNRLAVGEPYAPPGSEPGRVVGYAALASRAENRDPIDRAVLDALDGRARSIGYEVVEFTPFDPVTKRSEALTVAPDGTRVRVTKGAPQVVLELVGNDGVTRAAEHAIADFASRGERSLAVATRTEAEPWRLVGILPLADPPREDSASTVAGARDLGVTVKMVTGDQVAIAKQIAHTIGLGGDIVTPDALTSDDEDDGAAADLSERVDGFAQVFPEHKFRIVELLQSRGHVVGMTGDGVNDAPALKQADAGIAVSGANDAARAAADIVLLAPGLSVIIHAIRTSREIFQRMTSYAIYRIAETIRVLLLVSTAIVVFDFFPVTPVMIVLLALLNDAAILTIAYDNATAPREPAAWQMRTVLLVATALGVAGVVASFLLFAMTYGVFGLAADTVRTLMYLKLSVAGHLTIFVARTRGPFWSDRPARVLVVAVIGTQIIATLIAVYGVFMTAIGWGLAALVWVYALAWLLINDRVKLAVYAFLERARATSGATGGDVLEVGSTESS